MATAAVALLGHLLWPPRAGAAVCAASRYSAESTTRDEQMLEAGSLAANRRWADARAVYLDVRARHPGDAEALFGLARLDAWEGCWALAEQEYAEVVSSHPSDADVRAGLIDLLVWQGRYDDATRLLDAGLALDPSSPSLLARRARLAYFRGDATAAIADADAAERLDPSDADLRALRDRLFVGEARVTGHYDRYPPGYQDLYSIAGQVLERFGRYEAYGGVTVLQRYGGDGTDAVTDLRYTAGAEFHPGIGTTLGAELGVGAPANAIPDLAPRVWVLAPITTRISGYLSYALWHYHDGELVHLLNPAVGVALPANLRLDLRAWFSAVSLPRSEHAEATTKLAPAAGLQLTWSASHRVDVAAAYTYGAEIDQNPALFQLLEIRSHVVSMYADVLLSRHYGVRPLVALADRFSDTGPTVVVVSTELGAYVRW